MLKKLLAKMLKAAVKLLKENTRLSIFLEGPRLLVKSEIYGISHGMERPQALVNI